ncbi:MAG: hypothetical protein ACFFD4_39180 [Candidatus Odinarchaeota archaeon]
MKKQWIYTALILPVVIVPAFLMLSSSEPVKPLEIVLFDGKINDDLGQPPDPAGGRAGDDPGDAAIDEDPVVLPPPVPPLLPPSP